MDTEIICISSDDESGSQKENEKDELPTDLRKFGNLSVHTKPGTSSNDNGKVKTNKLKRKISQISEQECFSSYNAEKKQKLNVNQDTSKVDQDNFPTSNYSVDSKKNQDLIPDKLKLIIKERRKIYMAQDIFPLFISLCLQKCPEDDINDMEKIVNKLKKRYEELNPVYANSDKFVLLLNEKHEAIMNNNKKLYVYIEEVMNEMKKNINKQSQQQNKSEVYDTVPSTSYAAGSSTTNDARSAQDEENVEDMASHNTNKKIKKLLKTMEICEMKIKKLGEAEVDFDDENDSNYMKFERYKERIVDLYDKLCQLKGENNDAGRAYLRPKYISTTKIVVVDQAITNFINSKISNRKKSKKLGGLTKNIIFPDYRDILECINRCNDKKNLGLDKKKQEQMAKNAFSELGEYLQRARRNDYWDTFSLDLEDTKEDPALKDNELAEKLAKNRIEGDKKLTEVFEKYSKKQEDIKEQVADHNTDNETATEEESEDESDMDEESIDIVSRNISSEDEDNEEKMGEIIKETFSPIEPDDESNTCVANVTKNKDKTILDKVEENSLKKEEKLKMSTKEDNITVSKSENNSSNNIATTSKETDGRTGVNTHENSSRTPTTNCTDITDRTEENIAECVYQEVNKPVTSVETNNRAEILVETVEKKKLEEEVVKENIKEVITEKASNIVTSKTAKVSTADANSNVQSEEDQRPLLRVRSFAKPPTTWKDVQQNTDDIVKKSTRKVLNQSKDIIDLTNESGVHESTPVVAKCAVQRIKVLPAEAKSQTLTVPSSSNIINKQHATTKYLKVNVRNGKIVAPACRPQGPIIPISSAQITTIRQKQPQDMTITKSGLPYKQSGTIVKVYQPQQMFIVKKMAQPNVPNRIHINPLIPK